jgi:hypothetical protein
MMKKLTPKAAMLAPARKISLTRLSPGMVAGSVRNILRSGTFGAIKPDEFPPVMDAWPKRCVFSDMTVRLRNI